MLALQYGIAFADRAFEQVTVHYLNASTVAVDGAGTMELSRGIGNALAANAKHRSHQFLSRMEFVRRRAVQA